MTQKQAFNITPDVAAKIVKDYLLPLFDNKRTRSKGSGGATVLDELMLSDMLRL